MLLGNGNGTFQAKQSFGTGNGPGSVAVADFNGDGKSDLVVKDNNTDTRRACCSATATERFRPSRTSTPEPAQRLLLWATSTATAKADLVVPLFAGGIGSVLLGNGNGTFQAKQSFAAGSQPWQVAVG